jgi:hypothetical protein
VATSIALTLRTAYLALGRLLLWVKGHEATAQPLRLKERAHLPIRPYLADQAFDPGTIRNMSLAFENVCEVLRLTVSDDPGTRPSRQRFSHSRGAVNMMLLRCARWRSREYKS